MSDHSELKSIAEKAPTGPWVVENDSLFFKEEGYTRHMLDADAGHDVTEKDYYAALKFIAAANPAAVLALIAEVESLREHKQLLVDLREADGYESWASVLVMVDKLKAENEDLRKDAERYRFIRRSGGIIWTVIESQKKATGDLYDVGVDATMSKGDQP